MLQDVILEALKVMDESVVGSDIPAAPEMVDRLERGKADRC